VSGMDTWIPLKRQLMRMKLPSEFGVLTRSNSTSDRLEGMWKASDGASDINLSSDILS
jgi:hypothetical protein